MTKAEWSGWVQAFGSILAIAAGFLLVAIQVRQASKAEKEAHRQLRRRQLGTVIALVAQLQGVLKSARRASLGPNPGLWSTIVTASTRYANTFDAIPLLDFVDVGTGPRLGIVHLAAVHLRDLAIGLQAVNQAGQTIEPSNFDRALTSLESECQEAIDWFIEKWNSCSTSEEIERGFEAPKKADIASPEASS